MRYAIHILVGLLVSASFAGGLFAGLELFFEDILFSPKPISPEIVIVSIDNESIQKIGQWPWPREVFAAALSKLDARAPRALGLDVIFSESSRAGELDDARLERALASLSYPVIVPVEGDQVVLGGEPSFVRPPLQTLQRFRTAGSVKDGHVNLVLSADGVARHVPLAVEWQSGLYPALGLAVTGQAHTGRPALERIVYAGPPGIYPRVPFWRVIEDDSVDLSGKIVFIGATAADLHDEKSTPFGRGTQMPGVEIQANIANMILQGYRLRPLPAALSYAWLFAAAFIPGLFFARMRRPLSALAVNAVLGLVYTIAVIVLFNAGYAANLVHIHLAWILGSAAAFIYRYFTVDRERREMKNAFSKYVSKDILEEILRDPRKVKLGGEEKEVTVFFSDIRGFTSFSEKLSPTQLTSFLNRYLTVMTDIALARRGVLDKYIGDAVMAFWGAPLPNKQHAWDAVSSALAMIEALAAFNAESKEKGDLEINIGCGLNSGVVVAGNMGSTQRFDYTVMGDTVNLASRLEGQTKTYGVHIIASEGTINELGKTGHLSDITVREIDKIKVKGKAQPATIYQIAERSREAFVQDIIPLFDELRGAYYAGRFANVAELAKKIEARGEDGPTRVLAERAAYFIEHPPEHWEGVYEFKTK